MKRFNGLLVCLLSIILILSACGTSTTGSNTRVPTPNPNVTQTPKINKTDSFDFTKSEFVDNLSKQIVDGEATITPTIATFDLDDGVNEISPYMMKLAKTNMPYTTLQITANKKTKKVVSISIESEYNKFFKADGTSVNSTNFDFCRFVNKLIITLDKNINIDEFDKKYKLLEAGGSTQRGQEKNFYCSTMEIVNIKSFTFEPKNPYEK